MPTSHPPMSSLFPVVQWEAHTLLPLPMPLHLMPVSLGHFGPQFFSWLTHSSHLVWAQALLLEARLSQTTRDKCTAPLPSSFSICLPYFLFSFVDSKLIVWVYSPKGRELAWLFQAIFIEWINRHTQVSHLLLPPYPGGIQLRGFPFPETSVPLNHHLCPHLPPPRTHSHTHTFLTLSHPTHRLTLEETWIYLDSHLTCGIAVSPPPILECLMHMWISGLC